jgi:hypothetical protein
MLLPEIARGMTLVFQNLFSEKVTIKSVELLAYSLARTRSSNKISVTPMHPATTRAATVRSAVLLSVPSRTLVPAGSQHLS